MLTLKNPNPGIVYYGLAGGLPIHKPLSGEAHIPFRPALWWMWNAETGRGWWITQDKNIYGESYIRPDSSFTTRWCVLDQDDIGADWLQMDVGL